MSDHSSKMSEEVDIEAVAQEQLRFYNEHLTKQRGFEVIETPPGERGWRTHSLKPEYDFKAAPEFGTGLYVVHRDTGEICDHNIRGRLQWFCDGQVLLCTVCHFEGT